MLLYFILRIIPNRTVWFWIRLGYFHMDCGGCVATKQNHLTSIREHYSRIKKEYFTNLQIEESTFFILSIKTIY